MIITEVTALALSAPYWRYPGHPRNGVRNCVWVRIGTDAGITGWGEAYCGCYATEVTAAALRRFRRSLLGKSALDPAGTLKEMRFWNRYWAMRGIGAQSSSAIEAALWDIFAQAKNLPLWRVLGDGDPHPLLLYGSAGENARNPPEIREEVADYVEKGFRAYKIRCGGGLTDSSDRLSLDVDRVAAAREGLGPDRLLFVDLAVPQKIVPWTLDRAAEYFRALHPYGVAFIEEPAMTYDLAGYRQLQELRLAPTAGGESFTCPEEFDPFLTARAYGVAQPDAAVVGGPESCVQVIRRARECQIPVAHHAWSAGVGLAQNIQAGCSLGGVLAMEWPPATHPLADEPLQGIWRFEDGYLLPPSLPGLGVTITPELLARCGHQPDAERDY